MMPEFPDSILHTLVSKNGGVYDNAFMTQGVEAGDKLSAMLMDRYIKYLSIGVANVMKMFNPELILIGGGDIQRRRSADQTACRKSQEAYHQRRARLSH